MNKYGINEKPTSFGEVGQFEVKIFDFFGSKKSNN